MRIDHVDRGRPRRDDQEPDRRHARRRRRRDRRGRRASRLASSRARASTTTAPAAPTILEIAEADGRAEDQAAQRGALRLLGRRGVRPARLEHYVDHARAANELAKIYANLNFDMVGLAELRPLRLRRRRLRHRRRRRPARLRRDRGRCSTTYFAGAGPGLRADRVRRPLRLRPVHRRRHPGRRPVHRRRGHQDRRAGRDLRRHRRRRLRPLLPPGLRHDQQPEHEGAERDGRRGRARHADARQVQVRPVPGRLPQGRPGQVQGQEVRRRGRPLARCACSIRWRPSRVTSGSSRCCSTNSSKSRRARSSGVPVANGREPVARARLVEDRRARVGDGLAQQRGSRPGSGPRAVAAYSNQRSIVCLRDDDPARRRARADRRSRASGESRARLDRAVEDARPRRRRADRVAAEVGLARRAGVSVARIGAPWKSPGGSPMRASRGSDTSVLSISTLLVRGRRRRACPLAITSALVEPAGARAEHLRRRGARRPRCAPARPLAGAGSAPHTPSRWSSGSIPSSLSRSCAFRWPSKMRPDRAVGLRDLAHQRPTLLARVGGGVALRVRARRTRRGGTRGGRRAAAAFAAISSKDVTDGDGGHAACTTPGWKFGFPTGSASAIRRSGPGSSPVPRSRDQQRHQLARSLWPRPAARPAPMPSCASTIPPCSSSSCVEHRLARCHPPVVRVRVPPDDLQRRARGDLRRERRRCPHGMPPPRRVRRPRSERPSAMSGLRRPHRACDPGAAGARTHAPAPRARSITYPLAAARDAPPPAPRARRTSPSTSASSNASSTAESRAGPDHHRT